MLKTRLKSSTNGTSTIFYESTNGQTVTSVRSVKLSVVPDSLITVVYQDGTPYIYLAHKDMAFVTLKSAIEDYNLEIYKVS